MVSIDRSQSLDRNSHGFWQVHLRRSMVERAPDSYEVSLKMSLHPNGVGTRIGDLSCLDTVRK